MNLYHGTRQRALKSITKDGIHPRGKRKGNWEHSLESNPRCVYLSVAYPLYFAMAATNDSHAAIVEVDSDRLDDMDLWPDEDAVEQSSRGQDDLPEDWGMVKRTRYYRRRMHFYAGQWAASIDALGTCCHKGPIPASAITRVAMIDLERNMRLRIACDPSISLLNYKIMGGYYRQLTRLIFGDKMDMESIHASHAEALLRIPRDGIEVRTISPAAPLLHSADQAADDPVNAQGPHRPQHRLTDIVLDNRQHDAD